MLLGSKNVKLQPRLATILSMKHTILTLTMHFITCICTVRFIITAETGMDALTRCTAEVIIWTWTIKFITEVTTVILLVASSVTWHTAIVAALEVARWTCAQGCEYVFKRQIRGFAVVKICNIVFRIMIMCTLVGGYHVSQVYNSSFYRAEKDWGSPTVSVPPTSWHNSWNHNTNFVTCL
jgi:hypothetical protein